MILDNDSKFEMICEIGKRICVGYSGFSKTEITYCQQQHNWNWLRNIVFADNMYEMVILFAMSPIANFTNSFLLIVACLMDISEYSLDESDCRLQNVLNIIDKEDALDNVIKNTKMIRALLAVRANYVKSHPNRCFSIYKNSNKVLAHIYNKFPDFLKMNVNKTNSKFKKLRFNEKDVLFWLNC